MQRKLVSDFIGGHIESPGDIETEGTNWTLGSLEHEICGLWINDRVPLGGSPRGRKIRVLTTHDDQLLEQRRDVWLSLE